MACGILLPGARSKSVLCFLCTLEMVFLSPCFQSLYFFVQVAEQVNLSSYLLTDMTLITRITKNHFASVERQMTNSLHESLSSSIDLIVDSCSSFSIELHSTTHTPNTLHSEKLVCYHFSYSDLISGIYRSESSAAMTAPVRR